MYEFLIPQIPIIWHLKYKKQK